jgi:hypothetical protein
MTNSEFLIKISVVAEAKVIDIQSGDIRSVQFNITSTSTAPKSYALCCVEKMGKKLGKKMFVELFKNNCFNSNYVIVNFGGIVHLEIETPEHKIINKEKYMKINKDNFPKSVIHELADKFANFASEKQHEIINLLKLIAEEIFGINHIISNRIIEPFLNTTTPGQLSKLFEVIIEKREYQNMASAYISNGGGTVKTLRNFIKLKNMLKSPDKTKYQTQYYDNLDLVYLIEILIKEIAIIAIIKQTKI